MFGFWIESNTVFE